MHFFEVVLCGDVAVNRNQVDATKVGFAVVLTWEASHIEGRVAVSIDADVQGEGKLYQHELKPCCQPALGEGARKNNGFAGVEVQWVVLRGVVFPCQDYLLAADFAQRAWVAAHPGEEIFLVRLEKAPVTG
jgi:hypothetical protein